MTDYKELAKELREAGQRNSNSLNTRSVCTSAADAIETLLGGMEAYAKASVDRLGQEQPVVYVVTGYCGDFEPILTAFNSEEAARKYEKYAKTQYQKTCFDTVQVYNNFVYTGEKTDDLSAEQEVQ